MNTKQYICEYWENQVNPLYRKVMPVITLTMYMNVYWNSMLQKNVNICLNTNIYSNLETSSGQSSNL
jgi:hypothetical protein